MCIAPIATVLIVYVNYGYLHNLYVVYGGFSTYYTDHIRHINSTYTISTVAIGIICSVAGGNGECSVWYIHSFEIYLTYGRFRESRGYTRIVVQIKGILCFKLQT